MKRPWLVVVPRRNVRVLKRCSIDDIPESLAIILVSVPLGVMSPDPMPVLRLGCGRASGRLLSRFRFQEVGLIDEADELAARYALKSMDVVSEFITSDWQNHAA